MHKRLVVLLVLLRRLGVALELWRQPMCGAGPTEDTLQSKLTRILAVQYGAAAAQVHYKNVLFASLQVLRRFQPVSVLYQQCTAPLPDRMSERTSIDKSDSAKIDTLKHTLNKTYMTNNLQRKNI